MFGRAEPGGHQFVERLKVFSLEDLSHLAQDILVPDWAGWRKTRMPQRPATAYFPLAPDWICEVLSPSTVQIDRPRKLRVYAREGVAHAWLVDPLARTPEVLRLDGGRCGRCGV